ncbi:MAG TPA: sulfite exporter TauE/SafE family protein [Bryobacteraceae bacterium]|nr:sulfite exporter TauE/SafE family protein [Bryobacteraceae bacterium]
MLTVLFVALAIVAGSFAIFWFFEARKRPGFKGATPGPVDILIGFGTNFLDTLGVGSYATTSSLFKLLRLVPDEQIPGTMNAGHAMPTVCEAIIYITLVQVDMVTLFAMILASCAGAWLGAGVVSGWPRRTVQIAMGIALVGAAGFMLLSLLRVIPSPTGEALGVSGLKLGIAIVVNFILGALMTLGIGLFAPCMILIATLGMSPVVAFPIMMGSCAFLMPVGSARFVREGSYNLKSALGLTLGGIPGVLIAAYIVKSLPLDYVKWLVVVVVLYTASMMLRSAMVERTRGTVEIVPSIGN